MMVFRSFSMGKLFIYFIIIKYRFNKYLKEIIPLLFTTLTINGYINENINYEI